MSIIDKANEYVGHPKKMDESYTTTVRREGYAQGYQDAMDKACEVLKKHLFTQVVGRYDGEYSHFIQEVYTQVFPKFATAEDMIMVLRSEMEE
jgi:hypothetical protein